MKVTVKYLTPAPLPRKNDRRIYPAIEVEHMGDLSRKYETALIRSVKYIFSNFFSDTGIEESFSSQNGRGEHRVWIEIEGSFLGEIEITLHDDTLKGLIRKFHPRVKENNLYKHKNDVIGEMANLITGTFANQLQYLNHEIRLSPPEFEEDPIQMKALYNNINSTFTSSYGIFDVDLYYKDNEE